MTTKDSQGFYRILGLASDASQAEIKAAYRSKAMEFHPDRNPSKDTTSEFQFLQAAYDVLSNEKLRQQYDANSSVPPRAAPDERGSYKPMEPIVCSKCNATSAQPRYKVFYLVFGYVFGAYRKPRQGIFCSTCEIKVGLAASAITLVTGWWSISGFIWTIQTLFQNLVGGIFNEQNARIQGYQAIYFAQISRFDLARAMALEALRLADMATAENRRSSLFKKNLGYEASDPLADFRANLKNFINSLPPSTKVINLKNTNAIFNKRFVFQALLLLLITGLGALAIYQQSVIKREQEAVRLVQQGIARERAAAIAAQEAAELRKLERPLPANGVFHMASRSAYDPRNLPPLTVIGPSGSNTLMKLVRDADGAEVMSIFIRAGQTVEVGVPIGDYKVKIASGQIWYGDTVRFGPTTSYARLDVVLKFSIEGSQLLGHKLTLNRMRDGNMREAPLSANQF